MDPRSTTAPCPDAVLANLEHQLEVARRALMVTTDVAETDRLVEAMAQLRKRHRERQVALATREPA